MSNPLDPDRPGDLAALGISDRNPASEEMLEQDEEAQVTAAEEEVVEEAPEVEAEEPEQAEGEERILAQLEEEVVAKEKPSVEAELQRLRQEKLALEAALRERRAIAEERIKAAAETPKQEQEPESYLKSPYVQQTLRAIRDENPEQYEQTLIEIAKAEFQKELEQREKVYAERLSQIEKQGQEAATRTTVKQGIEAAFNKVRADGGLYAELVEEFQEKGIEGSHIGRMMMNEPERFYTQKGAEEAVLVLESRLRSQIARAKRKEPDRVVQGVVASAGSGVASTRGVNLNEKPIKKSQEDEYLDSFMGANRGGSNLDFL